MKFFLKKTQFFFSFLLFYEFSSNYVSFFPVGWDQTAHAPENWLNQMHNGHPEWKKQPNYCLLVDTRDREQPQMTYVPEENMEVIRGTKVLHPKVDDYFETYDGGQYLPRPWLRTLYPFD